MMTITMPEWFVAALLILAVLSVGLQALKAWLVHQVRVICRDRSFSEEAVRQILRAADR